MKDQMKDQMKDEKYVVFKRNEFYEMMGALALPPYEGVDDNGGNVDCAPIAEKIINTVEATAIDDAVVIRRQDVFSTPALDAYYFVLRLLERLQDIADHFHTQAQLAWNTDRKLPD